MVSRARSSTSRCPTPWPASRRPGRPADPTLLKWGPRLSPDALENRLAIVRPSPPRWLNRVELTGLALGNATIDLVCERAGEHVTLADAHIDGDAEVVLEITADRRGLKDPGAGSPPGPR